MVSATCNDKSVGSESDTMRRVCFQAYGHENVIGEHTTTVEITTETSLTKRGTCIIGVGANRTLSSLDDELRLLAASKTTQIILKMSVDGLDEEIRGWGSTGLTYSDSISMVVRKSSFECERTLMVNADKAASNLKRSFIQQLKNPEAILECELHFLSES
ncbi:MAG: DUF371 domain-containing protein [Promethearchaeota archaeon]